MGGALIPYRYTASPLWCSSLCTLQRACLITRGPDTGRGQRGVSMDEVTPRKQSASLTGRRVWLGSGCQSCWPWSGTERREGHR